MKNGLSPLHWWTINLLEHEDIYSGRWQSFAKMWQSTKSLNTTLWKVYISYTNICVYFVWCLFKLVYKFPFTNMPSDVPASLGTGTSITTSITNRITIIGALMFSLIYAWINDWINGRETGDLQRHRAHYNVTVMQQNNIYLDKEHVAVLECSLSIICQEFNNIDILTAYSCTIFQQHVNRSLPLTE